MLDEQGFYHLTPKSREVPDEKKKKNKIKIPKPKFKKGSWKHYLWKKISKWNSGPHCKDFHFDKLENIALIYGEEKRQYKVQGFMGKIKQSFLSKGDKDESFVFINCYDNVYTKVPVKVYKKLLEIHRMAISFQLIGFEDDGTEVDVFDDDYMICNINDLLAFVNKHRQSIEGVYELQNFCCGFVTYDFNMKIVVWMKNGDVKTYKGDMNDFMKDFGLRPY